MNHRTRLGFAAVLLALSASPLTAQQPPIYEGQVCFDGNAAMISVTATPTAAAALIYPVPPGGGYFMTDDGSGTYTHTIAGLFAGASLTFHLVIQIPLQFEFPAHTITLAEGCTGFTTADAGTDPDPDPDDTQPEPQTSRNFRQSVTTNGTAPALRFESGPPLSPLPATVAVTAHYRVNGGGLQTQTMAHAGGFVWTTDLAGALTGDVIDYFFTQTVGQQVIDTAWFRRELGQPAPAGPHYPLVTEGTARFRDRHANEWRFDHYVQGYDVGRTFDFTITDHGDSLDVELFTQPDVPVNDIDIKWFDQAGPQPFCGRANSAISMRMTANGGSFTATIPDLMVGQIVDIEFTLLASQTYYSEFFYYGVGSGTLDQRRQHPWAHAAGDASVSVVTIKQFSFNQHALNLSPADLSAFMEGKVLFETNFQDGTLFNPPTAFDCNGGPVNFNMGASPRHQPGALGPMYNNVSCIQCHMLDGRGRAPAGPADALDHMTIRVSVPGADGPDAAPLPHPYYGDQLAHRAIPGVAPEGSPAISYTLINGQFDDGTPYDLRRPMVNFTDMAFGPLGDNVPGTGVPSPPVAPYAGDAHYSPRIAPALIGLGLLEAVGENTILEYADAADADQDGISGQPNYVWDVESGAPRIGRFGWKAGQPSLQQQAASAFNHDMGLTSSLFPTHNCTPVEADCSTHADDEVPEIDDAALESLAAYLRGLTVPPRDNYTDTQAVWGKQLFEQANCHACHRPTMTTRPDYPIAGFRNQTIQPFTDLLLHDMGDDLADDRPEFDAGGERRTAPLWGVGLVGHVLGVPSDPFDPNGNPDEPNYLHDGRARSLMEAILWHGGEAEAARQAVLAMPASERDALIAYVEYPFADSPHLATGCGTGLAGDVNEDGSVDSNDLAGFASCVAIGPCSPSPCAIPRFRDPSCCNADTDTDGDVDLRDFASFARLLSGS